MPNTMQMIFLARRKKEKKMRRRVSSFDLLKK